jgi:hypothetical protein
MTPCESAEAAIVPVTAQWHALGMQHISKHIGIVVL